MNKNLEKFLKEINNGILKNSQKVIANALNIDITAVSKWCKGKNKPSEENIIKMAKIFKKSEEEIKNIFGSDIYCDNEKINMIQDENKKLKKEIEIRDELINFQREKIKSLEKKIKK